MAEGNSVYSLPINEFSSGVDHFESWISLFDAAIEITYKNATAADKQAAARQWLPLKLDDQARLIYSNVAGNTWAELKENLRKALIDPQEEYNWHAGKATITWDGVESFQCLATRVKRAVNTHQKSNKETEYYYRFILALPGDYQRIINLGLARDKRLIENAVDIAERVRVDSAGSSTAPSATTAFTGAAMSDDRIHSLELAMEGLALRVGNIESSLKKLSTDLHHRNRRSSSYGRSRRSSPDRDRYHRDEEENRNRGHYHDDGPRHDPAYDDERHAPDNRGRYDDRRSDWGRRGEWDRSYDRRN